MQSTNDLVQAMLTPQTYPEKTHKIELIQTHISFVFLTEENVYKIKKPVNFGFLDFSTLANRKAYCEKELQLNRRLCPEIYLDVVPISKSNTIRINGEGEIIEYALKMRRLPQERIMTQLLQENKIKRETIDQLASVVAQFHSSAETNAEITEIGGIKAVKFNWEENFNQTTKYITQTLTKVDYDLIQSKVNGFQEKNTAILKGRMRSNRIRDCHGDLHSGNIFVTDKICIFDAIEFNDRFQYSDVAADVAFLAMDLDYQQRSDLAEYFIERYIQYSEDTRLSLLLPFYKCYRAYVRGKVLSFRLDDPNINTEEKEAATKEASAYFNLAVQYAKTL
jgi:aminoglycoside phosphotransferase family enzyme